ncbi:hypothetical protein HB848_12075 [Listeria rocourtiae]|uniref:hypothetical protein n=1 Tax=Listeria rocourtiae TaxID=647910 RepID=UPI0016245914|nr:hypothetical protein [Listeria rocourtiae]MBC1436077.1 hypothetical protein [Listeria rocourtiae]
MSYVGVYIGTMIGVNVVGFSGVSRGVCFSQVGFNLEVILGLEARAVWGLHARFALMHIEALT